MSNAIENLTQLGHVMKTIKKLPRLVRGYLLLDGTQ